MRRYTIMMTTAYLLLWIVLDTFLLILAHKFACFQFHDPSRFNIGRNANNMSHLPKSCGSTTPETITSTLSGTKISSTQSKYLMCAIVCTRHTKKYPHRSIPSEMRVQDQ
jgi:hypothetical protein